MTGSGDFKATLVWMDPPSSTNARQNLVNDLDLVITSSAGQLHPNGKAAADTKNNVEMIEKKGVQTGEEYTVKVTATTLRSGANQPFALVVTGPFNAPGGGG